MIQWGEEWSHDSLNSLKYEKYSQLNFLLKLVVVIHPFLSAVIIAPWVNEEFPSDILKNDTLLIDFNGPKFVDFLCTDGYDLKEYFFHVLLIQFHMVDDLGYKVER